MPNNLEYSYNRKGLATSTKRIVICRSVFIFFPARTLNPSGFEMNCQLKTAGVDKRAIRCYFNGDTTTRRHGRTGLIKANIFLKIREV
jgi:hypothetical protein